MQDEQPSGATADYADLTARLRNTTLSGGQLLTPGSVAGCAITAKPWHRYPAQDLRSACRSWHIDFTTVPAARPQWSPSAEHRSELRTRLAWLLARRSTQSSQRNSVDGGINVADIQRSISGFESQLRTGTLQRTISGGQAAAKANAEAVKKASARIRGTLEDPRGG